MSINLWSTQNIKRNVWRRINTQTHPQKKKYIALSFGPASKSILKYDVRKAKEYFFGVIDTHLLSVASQDVEWMRYLQHDV